MKAKLISLGSKSKRMIKDRILNIDSDLDKEYVLGRNREAQCMILDVNVSRRHASVKFDTSRGWTVTDNKVRNLYHDLNSTSCRKFFFNLLK